MTKSPRRHLRLTAAASLCVVVGIASGAIADASASSGAAKSAKTRSAATAPKLRLKALARRTVAGSFVVATKQGFVTVTVARGTVESISGDQLTLAEGTRKATYKTVTLTLPADTKVRDNRAKSTLTGVSDGQRAVVIETADRALVVARTPTSK